MGDRHTDEELVEVGDGLYLKEDAEKISTWVELATTMLLYDHSKVDDLKSATRALGVRAQAQYPQLQSGDQGARLITADVSPFLDAYPEDTHLGFIVITGDALFSCIDGPNAGAVVLCDCLDQMHEAMARKGVYRLNDRVEGGD